MPRRSGSYGSYGNSSALYEASSRLPAWANGLGSAVGAYLTARERRQDREDRQKDKQDQWDREFSRANAAANANIAMANASIYAGDQEREAKDKANAEAKARQVVMEQLVGKALSGDRSAFGQVISGGANASTINAIENIGFKPPAVTKPTVYQDTLDREQARFDAKKKNGVPLFTPRGSSGAPQATNKQAIAAEVARIATFKERQRQHEKAVPGAEATPEAILEWTRTRGALGDSITAHMQKKADLTEGIPAEQAAVAAKADTSARDAKRAEIQAEMQALGQSVQSVLMDRSKTTEAKDRARAMLARENARLGAELNRLQ